MLSTQFPSRETLLDLAAFFDHSNRRKKPSKKSPAKLRYEAANPGVKVDWTQSDSYILWKNPKTNIDPIVLKAVDHIVSRWLMTPSEARDYFLGGWSADGATKRTKTNYSMIQAADNGLWIERIADFWGLPRAVLDYIVMHERVSAGSKPYGDRLTNHPARDGFCYMVRLNMANLPRAAAALESLEPKNLDRWRHSPAFRLGFFHGDGTQKTLYRNLTEPARKGKTWQIEQRVAKVFAADYAKQVGFKYGNSKYNEVTPKIMLSNKALVAEFLLEHYAAVTDAPLHPLKLRQFNEIKPFLTKARDEARASKQPVVQQGNNTTAALENDNARIGSA